MKANRKGRSAGGSGRFVQLHLYLMNSAAWLSLSPQARSVYLVLASIYDGKNNGYLGLGVRRAGELANVNKDTAGRCLTLLVERGFIECVTPGGFSRKTPHATEWRLTAFQCDRTKAAGSKAFLKWRPENSERGPKIRTAPSESEGQYASGKVITVPSFRTGTGG